MIIPLVAAKKYNLSNMHVLLQTQQIEDKNP